MTTGWEIRRAYKPVYDLPIPILYKRCPKEELMIRDITIKAVLNGFVVTVGCQAVVFTSREDLLENLSKYLLQPKETESEFRAKAINAKFSSDTLIGENVPQEASIDTRLR